MRFAQKSNGNDAFVSWLPGQPLTAPELRVQNGWASTLSIPHQSGAHAIKAWIEMAHRARAARVWYLAEGAFGLALRQALRRQGKSSDVVLTVAAQLAAVRLERSDMNGALSLQREILRRCERRNGAEHVRTLAAELELAGTLHMMGLFSDARRYQEHVLDCRKKSVGEHDPATADAMAALGDTLLYAGDGSEAIRLLSEALDINRSARGSQHASTLRTEDSLAAALWARQDFAAARSLQEHIRSCLPCDGVTWHDEWVFQNNLAATLAFQREFSEARKIQEHLLDTRISISGKFHPVTMGARANLAWTANAQGDPATARRLCESDLEYARQHLGVGHPSVFAIEGELFKAFRDLGDEQALRQLALEALDALPEAHASPRTIFRRYPDFLRALAAVAKGDSAPDWLSTLFEHLPRISTNFRDALELQSVGERESAISHYIAFHQIWVELCVKWAKSQLTQAIAPLHGLESWSAVLPRLLNAEFPLRSALHAALIAAKRELLEIRASKSALTTVIDATILQIADIAAWVDKGVFNIHNNSRPNLPIGELEIDDLQTELGRLRYLRSEQSDSEKSALRRYRDVRAELARNDSTMSALILLPALTTHDIAARLKPDEALLLTIVLSEQQLMILAIRPQATDVVEIGDLSSVKMLTQRYQTQCRLLTRGAGLRDSISTIADNSSSVGKYAAVNGTVRVARVQQLVRQTVWQPLSEILSDVRRIHLITGPGQHSLPLECGAPPGLPVHRYFGLPAYISIRDRPLPLFTPTSIDIVIDAAWGRAPIPFVEAEVELIRRLLKPQVRVRQFGGQQFLEGRTSSAHLSVSLHGGTTGLDAREHGLLFVESATAHPHWLDSSSISDLSTRISEVYASACFGAVVGNNDSGSALGLCSEWQIRGVTSIVACLGPVEDHFMPILTAMYWLRRQAGESPYYALESAKITLMSANWPEGLEVPMRRAYYKVMNKVLRRVGGHNATGEISANRVARTIAGWLLPPYVRAIYFGDDELDGPLQRKFSKAYCERAVDRERLISQCLGYLIDERAHPEDAVVRSFAQRAIKNICAVTYCFGSGGVPGKAVEFQ